MSRSILLHFVRFLFVLMAFTHTGAPYVRIGTAAPSSIVLTALCPKPHCRFAVLASIVMTVTDAATVWSGCVLKLNLLSRYIHKYSISSVRSIPVNTDLPVVISFPCYKLIISGPTFNLHYIPIRAIFCFYFVRSVC